MDSINNIVKKLRESRILNERQDYSNMDHRDLVRLAQEGDQLAIETLLKEYDPSIEKIASKFILDSGDEEDVKQIATIGFWEAIQSWDTEGKGSFGAYANNIMNRKLTDELRKDSAEKVKLNTYADRMDAPIADDGEGGELHLGDTMPSKDLSPEEAYMRKDYLQDLKQFIEDNFSDREIELFRLKFLKELNNDEIMEEMGMSYKAVSNTIMRIKNKLADYKRSMRDSKRVRKDEDIEFTDEERQMMKRVLTQIYEEKDINN